MSSENLHAPPERLSQDTLSLHFAIASLTEELDAIEPDFRLPGLLTHEERQRLGGGDWMSVERELGDVLAAVTKLDNAGYCGPYALALAPALYSGLFRFYPDSDVSSLSALSDRKHRPPAR